MEENLVDILIIPIYYIIKEKNDYNKNKIFCYRYMS